MTHRKPIGLLPYEIRHVSLLALLLCFSSCAPFHIQVNKGARQRIKDHKLIAILPFDVSMAGGYRPRGMAYADFQEKLQANGYELQAIICTHFQQHPGSARVLPPETTNRILSETGLTPDRLARLPKNELCSRLGVDAVVSGRTRTRQVRKNLSAASSAALLMFTGFMVVGSVESTQTDFDIRIHDAASRDYI